MLEVVTIDHLVLFLHLSAPQQGRTDGPLSPPITSRQAMIGRVWAWPGDSLMPGPEGRGNLMPTFLSSAVGPVRALVSLQSRNWDREFKWDLLKEWSTVDWWAFNEMQGIADQLFPESDIWFTVRKWVAWPGLIVIRKLHRGIYCKNYHSKPIKDSSR